ncbi:MAG TPA: GNAT family N-acetyltransferase [Natronosporangium sp.]
MGSLASLQYRAPWTAGRRDGGGLFRDEVIAQLVTGYLIRPVEARDEQAVLALVNADRVPGQPLATSAMLAEALAGRSSVDSGWWAELADLTTEVATTRDGEIVGVVSYATRPRDGVGIVLWLHGREDRGVIDTLLDHTLSRLEGRTIEAFSFATALSLGMEALPVRHRPATAAALTDHGFLGSDLWRYMRVDLPVPGLPRTPYTVSSDEDRRTLTVRDGTTLLGEATIGLPVQGIGVLWWISVEPTARGRGLGKALLGSALDLLHQLGAQQVILYVDDDEPGGERDRTAANRLYEQAGFVEVDRLLSYKRPAG